MRNSDCLFCKIIKGKIPSTKVFENERVLGFKDIHPLAALHYVFIHKDHTQDINEMMGSEPLQIQEIFSALREVSIKEAIDQKGFRVVTNLGPHGGQSVFHTHFHLLGGEPLGKFGR
jgi:histidine triad (HIT) family protein